MQRETPGSLCGTFHALGYQTYRIQNNQLRMCAPDAFQIDVNTDYLFLHPEGRYKLPEVQPEVTPTDEEVISGVLRDLTSDNALEIAGSVYALQDSEKIARDERILRRIRQLAEKYSDHEILRLALGSLSKEIGFVL